MTPIKYIGRFECIVFTVDFSGFVEIQAISPNEEKAKWVAWSLAKAHEVEAKEVFGMPLARFVE